MVAKARRTDLNAIDIREQSVLLARKLQGFSQMEWRLATSSVTKNDKDERFVPLEHVASLLEGDSPAPFIEVPRNEIVFWGRTANQLSQLLFLEQLVSNAPEVYSTGIALHRGSAEKTVKDCLPKNLISLTLEQMSQLYSDRAPLLKPESAMTFFRFLAGWYVALEEHQPFAGVVAVANDHSPRYVAASAASNLLKIPTIYIQHAPVTQVFPETRDFDAVILMNQESKSTYSAVGQSSPNSFVFPRPNCEDYRVSDEPQESNLIIGIFLTRTNLLNFKIIRKSAKRLRKNPQVAEVRILPHPGIIPYEKFGRSSKHISSERADLDVVMVGNSGVVDELTKSRSEVYYLPELDNVAPFYHPVSNSQGVKRIGIKDLSHEHFRRSKSFPPESKTAKQNTEDIARFFDLLGLWVEREV